MPKRPYESQRMPYRDYQRSRYNKSVGYPLAYRTGRFIRAGYNPGPPYVSRLLRYRGLTSYPQSGIETKFFDTVLVATAVPQAAATAAWTGQELNPTTFLCFNCPEQGTGSNNREGRMITMGSLQITGTIRFTAQADQTAADTSPTVYLFLVLDTQTNGAQINSEDVYTNPTTTQIGGTQPLRNMAFSKRFKVLKIVEVKCPQLPIAYDGMNIEQSGVDVCFDMFKNLKGLKTEFLSNSSPSTVANVQDNGLFLLGVSSNTTVNASLTYNARLRFRG